MCNVHMTYISVSEHILAVPSNDNAPDQGAVVCAAAGQLQSSALCMDRLGPVAAKPRPGRHYGVCCRML
jgi:hypothetical protein